MTATTRRFEPTIAARIEARLSELLVEYRIPSASIGILQEGVITDLAVGVRNVSTRRPATTDTTYGIGSMTKAWTALAFMQLVDEGKVSLDEPVRKHLSGFRVADPTVSAELTPRHLLNRTNGIEEAFGDPGERDDVYQRMVENIRKAPQVHPLGYTHSYSAALGYAILARIMEVVDDAPWDTIMAERLFLPLGLTRTSSRREQVDPSRAATPYITRSPEEGPIPSPLTCTN
jgi:CubicO group peptidase (beta-lactamase class C family)